ncbi:hypothetical protein N7507_007070 [Penicillium longicatenatum]|nr:hypothetical protein N7507_007070 [Penicillium longicatenatum]
MIEKKTLDGLLTDSVNHNICMEDLNLPQHEEAHSHDLDEDFKHDMEPSIPTEIAYKTLLRSRRLISILGCAFIQITTMGSFEVTLPLHLKVVADISPSKTALAWVPLMVPALFAPICGRCCELGNRAVACSGYILLVSMLILLRFHDGNSTLQEVALFGDLSLKGFAITMIMTPVLAEVSVVVDGLEEEKPGRFGNHGAQAQAYGLLEFLYSSGTLVGPLIAPVARAIVYQDFVFDMSGMGTRAHPVTEYEGPPSPESNVKWYELLNANIIALDHDMFEALGQETESSSATDSTPLIHLEVLHQLHCLNSLRG